MDRQRHEELTEEASQALAAGDYVRALAVGDQITAMDPEDPVARVIRSHALLAGGGIEEAYREAQIAALLDPENEDAQMALALSAWRNGRIAVAADAFGRAVRLSGEDPGFAAQYAWFLANEQPAKAAIALAEEVLAKESRSAAAWAAIGLAQLRLKRLREAEFALRTAVELDPDSPEAQSAMVRLLKRRGDVRQADELAAALRDARRSWPVLGAREDLEEDQALESDAAGSSRWAELISSRPPVPWRQVLWGGFAVALGAGLALAGQWGPLAFLALVLGLAYAAALGRRLRRQG